MNNVRPCCSVENSLLSLAFCSNICACLEQEADVSWVLEYYEQP